jgi:hypothetical protein
MTPRPVPGSTTSTGTSPSWLDYVPNRHVVDTLYSVPPLLDELELFTVLLDREGPLVTLRFNLARYADTPPELWGERKYNTVQIELRCMSVRALLISGWEYTNTVSIRLRPLDDEMLAVALSGDTTISFECSRYLDIKKISAYQKVAKRVI